jgi:hypothetical protein
MDRDLFWALRYPAYSGFRKNAAWFLWHPVYATYWATHNGRPYSQKGEQR